MRASKQPGTSKQASKHLWWGQEDGQEEKAAKITAQPKRRQSHGVGFHKLALFSGTTGPFCRIRTPRQGEKHTRLQCTHMAVKAGLQGSEGAGTMPQNAQELHSQIDDEQEVEEEGEDGRGKIQQRGTVSGPGENKSSQRLHGCRLLLATATKLMRFLAPSFHRRTAHAHTHAHTPLARSSRREEGCFSPPRCLLVHRLGDEVEKALGILLGVHR